MAPEEAGKARVAFSPDRTTVEVDEGVSVLEACRRAGIEIDAVCGGEGKCGRCRVKVEGEFSSEPSPLLTEEDARAGFVLACLAKVQGALSVEIPSRSRLGRHQILTRSVEHIPKPLSPWVKKMHLELPPATIGDSIADLERLRRALHAPHIEVPLEVLRELPGAIRSGGWRLTLTMTELPGVREVARAEPGDATGRLLGIAVDIGTTTVVVELVDLLKGEVLGTASDYNRQISRGEDVIARMIHSEEAGVDELNRLVLETINGCIAKLLEAEGRRSRSPVDRTDIVAASVAGNTIMTHFFVRLGTETVRFEPYVPVAHHLPHPRAWELGLDMNPAGRVLLFPSRAGYVGGDVIADVLASGMHRSRKLTLLVDVGTNGEIVLGGRDWMATCSCSAGPAFEGGEVSSGMRAMDGAIDRVRVNEDLTTSYHVLGEVPPVGICGSGLIDLVAEMYEKGVIDRKARIQELGGPRVRPSDSGLEYVVEEKGRLGEGASADLVVTDADLQNLLRTKAAIHGACSVLLRKTGKTVDELHHVVIAGGFGYHLDIERAISIGMFPDLPREKYVFIGNGALGGARHALLCPRARKEMVGISQRMTYFELSVDNEFYDEFSSSLFLPHTDLERFPSAGAGGTGRGGGR